MSIARLSSPRATTVALITIFLALFIAAGLIPASEALAATINVDTINDEYDAVKGPGDCSLREAVIAANRNQAVDGCEAGSGLGTDVISLPPGQFELTIEGEGEDDAETGDLDIRESVEFVQAESSGAAALGDDTTTIDAGGSVNPEACDLMAPVSPLGDEDLGIDRVFHLLREPTSAVPSGPPPFTVSFSDLTIAGGTADEPDTLGGGGILAEEATVDLNNVVVEGNGAFSLQEFALLQGGGIALVEESTLEMTGSLVQHNGLIGYGAFGGGLAQGAEINRAAHSQEEFKEVLGAATPDASTLGGPTVHVDVADSEFNDNFACGAIAQGGGASVFGNSQFLDADFTGNLASGVGIAAGGGLSLGYLNLGSGQSTSETFFDEGTFSGNQAEAFGNESYFGVSSAIGGGIAGTGTSALTRLTVENNTALGDPVDGENVSAEGGGITYAGTLGLSMSTVSDNLASALEPPPGTRAASSLGGEVENGDATGGGVVLFNASGEIGNSTISGNTAFSASGIRFISSGSGGFTSSASTSGGGGPGSSFSLLFSTVTDNTGAGSDEEAVLTSGSNPGDLNIRASIIANQETGGDCDDDSGEDMIQDQGKNIDSDGTCTSAGSSQTANPRLEELDDNGGDQLPHMLTHALKPNSPAIDIIPLSGGCATIDQRGVPRPQNGDGAGDARCDAGAFELEPSGPAFCPGFASDPRPQIVGTAAANTLNGTGANEIICGKAGVDTINGNGGNDLILGGPGGDTLRGNAGDDTVEAAGGDDTVLGGAGNDRLRGFGGEDNLSGDDGRDHIRGGDDVDDVSGGNDNDDVFGFSGNDRVAGGLGADTVFGSLGDDTVDGGPGSDRVRGHLGDDKLFGRAGEDVLIGNNGDDDLDGGPDTDTCFGGPGTNTFASCP